MKNRLRTYLKFFAGLFALLLLIGCSDGEPDFTRTPSQIGSPLPPVADDDLWLPIPYMQSPIVEPAWDAPAQWAGDVLLASGQKDEYLEFSAVNVFGEELWSARRPLTCTGFAVSVTADDHTIAVLLDTETTSSALAQLTASAYDLASGQLVWGPVELPGPLQGPGLVFATPPADYIGELGLKVALDPSTGEVFAQEVEGDSLAIIGEYHGVLLVTLNEELIARDIATDEILWQIPLSEVFNSDSSHQLEHDFELSAMPGANNIADSIEGYALVRTSPEAGILVDLHDGSILAHDAQQAIVDASTQTVLYLDAQGLHALDPSGQELWAISTTTDTSIAAAGGVFVYLLEGDAVRVHNALTGDVVMAYDPEHQGRIMVPQHISINGAALFVDGQRQLLATIPDFPYGDG